MQQLLFQPGTTISRILFLLGLAFFVACANVVSPTGGPKDEVPPAVVRSFPENYSPNYDGGQIRIFFDEFVTLANLGQQLLVSPPLEKMPEVRTKGRSIIIDIKEELRPNTTYNMFFGDAIRDITEGNAIPNFQYVFSTGDYVDSLSLAGKVVDAFTLKPLEGISVMLYDSIYDSIPYKERPVYFARTNKEGGYAISNMKEGNYLLFGLKDNNSNFLYDLPDEMIAFVDSLVSPEFVALSADSLRTDTVGIEVERENVREAEGESGRVGEGENGREGDVETRHALSPLRGEDKGTDDRIGEGENVRVSEGVKMRQQYVLYMFQEADTLQRITSSSLVARGQVRMTFRVPFDSVCARDIRGDLPEDWYMPEFSRLRDTLTLWLRDVKTDSLFLEIYDGRFLLDTVKLSTTPRETRSRAARGASAGREESELDEDTVKPDPVSLTSETGRGRPWPYYLPFTARASAPLSQVDNDKITIMVNDSIHLEPVFSITGQTDRAIVMDSLFQEKQGYKLIFLPGALTSMFGGINDTITFSFNTSEVDDYGILIFNMGIPGASYSYILQLLDKDGVLVMEKPVTASETFRFHNLAPGNYGFRLIEDLNGNGKWDTGNYLKGILPERVFMYTDPLQVRQGWEAEEEWNVGGGQ